MPLSRLVGCTLVGIWLLMLFFTTHTPMAYDDYSFILRAPHWSDVIPAAINSYYTWNGRFLAETLGGFLVLAPPVVYYVGTATAFVALLWCMLVIAYGRNWRTSITPMAVVLVFALVWFSVPAFGCAFLWRVGTANFLWTSLAVFGSFIPFRLLLASNEPVVLGAGRAVLLGLLCFCAGLSNENLGILTLFFAGGVFAIKWRKRELFSRKYYAVALCVVLGMLCLLLAPGNYVRLQVEVAKLPAAVTASFWAKFPYWVEKMLMGYALLATALVVFCALLYCCRGRIATFSPRQKEAFWLGWVFCLFGMMASGALYFSPSYPLRAFTGISLLYVQAAMCTLVAVQAWLPRKKILAVGLAVLLGSSVLYQARVFYINKGIERERLQIYATSEGRMLLCRLFKM